MHFARALIHSPLTTPCTPHARTRTHTHTLAHTDSQPHSHTHSSAFEKVKFGDLISADDIVGAHLALSLSLCVCVCVYVCVCVCVCACVCACARVCLPLSEPEQVKCAVPTVLAL